jgi:hypothetical protein
MTIAVEKIVRFEEGEMDEEETIAFFQELIDGGLCWQLQGHYGRMASAMIDAGYCTPAKEDLL